MTKIRKSKIYILVLLMLLLPLISTLLSSVLEVNEEKNNIPRSSGFWVIGPLHIDDTGGGDYNWTEAVAQPWCSGNGSLLNPYLLENITIDGNGNGFCISIQNSDVYFEIRNCDLFNAGSSSSDSAIVLYNVENAKILGNNLTDNNVIGIKTENSHNNTFIGNNASDTTVGFSLHNSDFNLISKNTVMNCIETGISVHTYSNNNSITGNTVIGCNVYGILIFWYSHNNTVSGNAVVDNTRGITMYYYSQENRIFDNIVEDNSIGVSIRFSNSTKNTVYSNTFLLNNMNAEDNSYNVNYWNYGTLGNYWDDYGGVDANDDGIGDTAYAISGIYGRLDNFPIWDDGDDIYPTIIRNSPSAPFTFGTTAPVFNLTIFDLNLHMAWYKINQTYVHFFTPVNGINIVSLDQTSWDALSEGSLSIGFFVNDTAGNLLTMGLSAIKEVPPTISLNSPPHGSSFGTDAPTYSLNIFDLNLNTSWYTLNNTVTRYFFTPSNGINVVPIDQTGWDYFSEGYMVMGFFVNDSSGNTAQISNVIYKDATNPTIVLNSPLGGTTFGSDAPEFNLTIYDLHLHEAWYTLGSSATPHSFSPINGINMIPIDESSWDALPEGSVTINFYVNDTAGNTRTIQVIINKDLPSGPAIPFGNYYFLFLGIGIATLLLAEQKKRKK